MGTHPIFESDFDCLTELFLLGSCTKRKWRYFEISIVDEEMAQQSTGPTWTRLLTIALYLLFASLPALSFAIFYALLWQGDDGGVTAQNWRNGRHETQWRRHLIFWMSN